MEHIKEPMDELEEECSMRTSFKLFDKYITMQSLGRWFPFFIKHSQKNHDTMHKEAMKAIADGLNLHALHNTLRSGACHWAHMSKQEFEEFEKELAQEEKKTQKTHKNKGIKQ
ncbi:hypothetical protein ARMGADRAFT_1029147 [Armillaria gallica]|uniref:Uncharacterized protein n=1 Tax=Armillaria gallica TaxID=47427 RepID=A0A2H3DHT4_ARMGA|nr:hypothetical protein ARMGADRAFT_1029147 [Armillaria gallica]